MNLARFLIFVIGTVYAILTVFGCHKRGVQNAKDEMVASLLGGSSSKLDADDEKAVTSETDTSLSTERHLNGENPAAGNNEIPVHRVKKPGAMATMQGGRKGGELFLDAKEALANGDLDQAKDLYLQSCAAGYLYGCHRFGWHQKGAADKPGSMRFYEVACRKGFWKSCNNLGWIAEKGKNDEKAADYYSMACLHAHPGSCQNLQRVTRRRMTAH